MIDFFKEIDAITTKKSRDELHRPPFSYPGNKYRLAEKIIDILPPRERYIEPCGGTFCVGLNRPPSKLEVFNDIHPGITHFYRVLRNHSDKLANWLELTVHSREEWVHCKESWDQCDDPVEKAGRWYYALEYSFGALGRNYGRPTGVTGGPFSGKLRERAALLPYVHERLKNVNIECQDVFQVIDDYDHPDAVFYIDPPYLNADTGIYGNIDHKRLIERIFSMEAFVAVSGHPHIWYDAQKWDDRYEWQLSSTIKSMSFDANNNKEGLEFHDGGRELRTEILWIKESK